MGRARVLRTGTQMKKTENWMMASMTVMARADGERDRERDGERATKKAQQPGVNV